MNADTASPFRLGSLRRVPETSICYSFKALIIMSVSPITKEGKKGREGKEVARLVGLSSLPPLQRSGSVRNWMLFRRICLSTSFMVIPRYMHTYTTDVGRYKRYPVFSR